MKKSALVTVSLIILALSVSPASPDERAEAQSTVDRAVETLKNFKNDPEMDWFREHVKDAQALLIVPTQIKGGLIFGGSGGRGVLVKWDGGQWIGPAFYNMGSGSVGLQIGVEVSEVILMAMTKKGVDPFLNTKMQLGADASVAAGPVGVGTQAATADILGFARSKGAYAGLSLEGAVITPDDSRNQAYYGADVTPTDILVRRAVSNERASPLLEAVSEMR